MILTAAVLRQRFVAFVAERTPFALALALDTFDRVVDRADDLDRLRVRFDEALQAAVGWPSIDPRVETTPGVPIGDRLNQGRASLQHEIDGFFRREAIAGGLTRDERLEILRGMVLTRAVDAELKRLFSSADARFRGVPFAGKGFRSLGQEAIYAAAIRLRRGAQWRAPDGSWQGDVVAPIIRDVGVVLAMRPESATVRMILNAQAGKAGPPMDGRDLHIGDFPWGILPAAAPLGISTLTATGLGLAFARTGADRVACSFIGEGGSSLGEWHEAINLCAVRRLPVIFCLENNQMALSTPVAEQSAVRTFADKAVGYGIPGVTIDGTDPDAIAAAFAWAAERARAGGGATLIELVAMRMCGHAHHDDMLYLGSDPPVSWQYPAPSARGYVDPVRYEFWRARDPIATYATRLEGDRIIGADDLKRFQEAADEMVQTESRALVAAPWPDASTTAASVFAGIAPPVRVEVLDRAPAPVSTDPPTPDSGPPFATAGSTFLEAITLGIGDALAADTRTFVFGEDVGGPYGNVFLLLRPLLDRYGHRLVNAPLAEAAVLGAAVGAALAGLRPIAEVQFNDFVATGFNQLVNNAAKIRYRWGGSVPMVVRMPWGGLRRAGPFHSQNTEAWFYRTPGLKIVVPSTPADARALMASAVADPDPVLYYEHIALYRDPRIRQVLSADAPRPLPVGRAALRRVGPDVAIVSYGAYVHVALRVAATLASDGIEASVLDLRWLAPLDREAVLALARYTGRVLIVHEDSRTGGIGESLASIVQEAAFEWLDAPVQVVGALDTPVPYSPPLEDAFLPSEEDLEKAVRRLVEY